MMWMTAILLAIAAPLAAAQSGQAPASLANEQLSDASQEARAMALMKSLRCIQCQGQSIADSDAPIAAAMRGEVRERIQQGDTADAIRDWMILRYGEWVSFEPPMNAATLILWFAPLLMLFAALWLARGLFGRSKP